jgi:hypothetical protein
MGVAVALQANGLGHRVLFIAMSAYSLSPCGLDGSS